MSIKTLTPQEFEYLKQQANVFVPSSNLGACKASPLFDAKFEKFLVDTNRGQGEVIQEQERKIQKLEWSRDTWMFLAIVFCGVALLGTGGLLWFWVK